MQCNKRLFARAKHLFTLSDGMRDCLGKYVSKEKIKVIPNWSHSRIFSPIHKTKNIFLKKHNLENQFVVLYSGNIGESHDVEVIIEVANLLSNHTDIKFLIIGEGMKKKKLQRCEVST